MPLRLGVDLDGVLADMEGELSRQADILFGPSTPNDVCAAAAAAGDPSEVSPGSPVAFRLRLTMAQRKQLWRHVRGIDGFWEQLNEIEPGTVARLGEVATERRWEVIFLTKRPATAGATAQQQSQRWLHAHGFPLPSVFTVNTSRGKIAAALALDVVVDDSLDNCLDVVNDSKACAIGVLRHAAGDLSAHARLGIDVVRSAAECLQLLCDIDARQKRPGAIGRVLRTLGLKPSGV